MRKGNILFVHIPRTAGTHFEINGLGFSGHGNGGCGSLQYGANHKEIMGWDQKIKIMLQHATYNEMVKHNFIEKDNDLIKISIVRNPYRRVISLYNYFGGEKKHESFELFLDSILSGSNAYNYFYAPQWKYLDGAEFNLIKFENYCEDLEAINKKFNLNIQCGFDSSKPKANKKALLTKENIKKINKLYKKDFELFGYSEDYIL